MDVWTEKSGLAGNIFTYFTYFTTLTLLSVVMSSSLGATTSGFVVSNVDLGVPLRYPNFDVLRFHPTPLIQLDRPQSSPVLQDEPPEVVDRVSDVRAERHFPAKPPSIC